MRVNDVFNYCTITGHFEKDGEIPAPVLAANAFFVIATISGNVQQAGDSIVLHDHPRKHIGICLNKEVWNFSNSRHFVVRDTIRHFFAKMRRSYGASTTFLYAYRQDI